MKKIIGSIITAVLGSMALAVPVFGQSQSLFYGEYHNYSVTFKEDGEAVIFAKLIFTNSTDKDQSTYSFSSIDTELKELTALQVKLPQECAEYSQVFDPMLGRSTCARYRDPDYNSYYYYSYGATEEITYRRADIINDGLKYTVTLPDALKPEKTTALLLAYTSPNYTKNNFLAKSYNFPTLTIGNRITEAKIGISVDEGLVLEGVVNPTYCTLGNCPISATKDIAVSSIGDASAISAAPVTNRSLDNLYASIGTGQKVFEAKSIAPDKSFNADGRYATSEMRLNASRFVLAFTIIGVVLLTIVILSLKLRGKTGKNISTPKGKWGNLRFLSNLVPVASLIPMASIVGGTWYLSTKSFTEDVWNTLGGAGKPLLVIFIVLIYAVLVTISPVIYGIRSGWRAVISVVIMQAIWVTLLLVISLPLIIFSN